MKVIIIEILLILLILCKIVAASVPEIVVFEAIQEVWASPHNPSPIPTCV
jgi:hypothetical protein